jgi:hypothetical protein
VNNRRREPGESRSNVFVSAREDDPFVTARGDLIAPKRQRKKNFEGHAVHGKYRKIQISRRSKQSEKYYQMNKAAISL